jgi:sulfur relay (sulfurtransferase) DsrF/TusC family protein
MARKVLSIVESAYRATIEEQDDTVVWVHHAMKAGGADLTVLLRGNAVSYAIEGQDASGLSFGGKKQTQPPRLAEDLAALIARGVEVHVVEDDAAQRGIERTDFIQGVKPISRAALPGLLQGFDQVWHW